MQTAVKEFDRKFSLIQSETECRKIIVNLSKMLKHTDLESAQRDQICGQIILLDGMADLLKILSFRA